MCKALKERDHSDYTVLQRIILKWILKIRYKYVDLSELAQDRGQQQSLLNKLMTPWEHLAATEMLTRE
jgi:hypothetical protein